MKVIANREGLLAASQLISTAVASREIANLNPVLSSVKATASRDRLILAATDTEVGIRIEVRSVSLEKEGEALLPSAKLLTILRELEDEEITLEAGDTSCGIIGSHSRFELPGQDPTTYPSFPEFSEDSFYLADAGPLRALIRRTQFAVTTEETRYRAMSGVLWELVDGKLRLVATDGRRLAIAEGDYDEQGQPKIDTSLPVAPLKFMTLLERNLVEPEEKVHWAFRPNDIVVRTERATIFSRLVEGRFPDYRAALPAKPEATAIATVGPLLRAIRQAAITVEADTRRVRFTFDKGSLVLEGSGGETGRSRVETEIEYNAKPLTIDFDPRFWIDMLRVLEPEDKLTVGLNGPTKAALIKNEAGDFTYVVVPMVVRD